MNSVQSLLEKPFSTRTLEEKIEIKLLGRPTPDLNITQNSRSRNSAYKRNFSRTIYKTTPWLCGCPIKNALFCFPCLLFGGEPSWWKSGITKLSHITEYIKRHNENKRHMSNIIDLGNLGKVDIATQLDTAYRLNIKKHNEQVEKNRYILSKIIDCIKFCGAFEFAIIGNADDESDTSNSGVFVGLIDLMGSIDNEIKNHIDSNSVFKGISKKIQNKLLDSMLHVCREEIKKQLIETKFIAIMADDTTDISEKIQTVLVFRYEYEGKIYERFWGFLNPAAQNPEIITNCLFNEIQPLINHNEKVISQSYDGAAFMSGKNNGVQAKMKKIFTNAHFTHCYAHELNSIMTQCASQNQSARVFFCSLTGIPAFFSHSPLRLAALEEAPKVSATRWNFKSGVVNVVFENKEELIECFLELEKSHSSVTVREARGLRHYLEDKDFNFWLSFFHKIMPHVDDLYNQIQSLQTNAVHISKAINNFISIVEYVRNEYVEIEVKVENEETTNASTCKRRAKSHNLAADAEEVCDLIIIQAKDRFEFVGHLELAKLLDSSKFLRYCHQFPDNELNIAGQTYPFLNTKRLKTELQILYEREDFRNNVGVLPLLNFLLQNNLDSTFEELTKLLRILITTPITTSEAERSFSTLKRIKSFLRNTMTLNRLNCLAMLSIEKELVKSIPDFNTRIIEHFVMQKDQQMDFTFQK